MRALLTLFLLTFAFGHAIAGEGAKRGTLYKNPQCVCCDGYTKYLEKNGFEVAVEPLDDVSLIKPMAGVPSELQACHTLMIDGYAVEGHVPVNTLNRLLTERPDIKGIAVPGMPMGSPGMGGEKEGPLTIYELSDGPPKVYAVE